MGSVKLISITQPLVKTEDQSRYLTPEELIVYCARVSNPSNQLNVDTAPKLIKYCMEHGHWSIFEQVGFCVEIKTSRAISAQILRHRSFSFQEFSQRYASVQSIEPIEIRKQGATNRQVGDEEFNPKMTHLPLTDEYLYASDIISNCLEDIKYVYEQLIEAGVAKECARMILPMASSSTLYMNGNLRSWIHYLQLRTGADTQKEHRDIANQVKEILVENFPIISKSCGFDAS